MRLTCLAAVLSAAVLAGCFGGQDEPDAVEATVPPAPVLTGAEAQARASPTAGTLAQVPNSLAARTRLAYANVDALRGADVPVAPERVLRAVLGRVPASGAVADPAPAVTAPEESAITPVATSAVQSCLGDTLAQTILGPRTMGFDAALGAGLAEGGGGVQLRICGAPRYLRHIHAMEKALHRRYDGEIGEQEIGEREIVFATVPADSVPPAELVALLGARDALRAPAWR